MIRWRTIIVLLLCLALAGTMACGSSDNEQPSQQLVEVVWGDLTVSVGSSGYIEVSNEARLAFGSGGRLDKIYVEAGDNVTEGDVLAMLDTGTLELALAQAQVALLTAEYNLEETQDIYAKADVHVARAAVHEAERYLAYAKLMLDQSTTEKDLKSWANEVEDAKENLRRAEVRLNTMLTAPDTREVAIAKLEVEVATQAIDEAQRQIDEATITAPFDGVVASVNAKEKDVIPSPTMAPQTIIYLIDPSSMELKAEVDEIDIAEVKPGQRAVIEVDALPALQLEGKVIAISPVPVVEAGVVLYEVKIGFGVPEGSGFRVGMSATADIITNERSNVLLVPSRAIKHDSQGNPVVKVMVDEQIEERPVVIGISDGFQTEIVDGLNEGETVVVER